MTLSRLHSGFSVPSCDLIRRRKVHGIAVEHRLGRVPVTEASIVSPSAKEV